MQDLPQRRGRDRLHHRGLGWNEYPQPLGDPGGKSRRHGLSLLDDPAAQLARGVVLCAARCAAGAAVGTTFFGENRALAQNFGNPVTLETDENVQIKYSFCLGCHNGCGIRCKVVDGILVKVDGNPYHPKNLEPHVAYGTDPDDAKLVPGGICAKGQSGLQVLYNPFRIKEPLKRVGGELP